MNEDIILVIYNAYDLYTFFTTYTHTHEKELVRNISHFWKVYKLENLLKIF